MARSAALLDETLTWRFSMRRRQPLVLALVLVIAACSTPSQGASPGGSESPAPSEGYAPGAVEGNHGVAVFAGGCFWCVESAYDDLPGVLSAVSGYTGGRELNPAYSEVSSNKTTHVEAVRVVFDPKLVSYARLLDVFWQNIDPFQANGQFCDQGKHYRSAIYYADEAQQALATTTRAQVAKRFGQDVVTELNAASTFWPAEDYHQDFHVKNPVHYRAYRMGCGRDRRLEALWGKKKH